MRLFKKLSLATVLVGLCFQFSAQAQSLTQAQSQDIANYPNRPIKLIVPVAADDYTLLAHSTTFVTASVLLKNKRSGLSLLRSWTNYIRSSQNQPI
jgi:hypothetical protein